MPKILVVEDMPDSAQLVHQVLSRYGHQVVLADTGELGLAMIEQHQPDLIVLDILLPDLDAKTFLRRLRAGPTAHIPVIACSATTPASIEQSLGKDVFHAIVHKPFRVSAFLEIIDQHLPAS